MAYLFLDSTNGLVIGLLDEHFHWLSYKAVDEKKPSEIVHYQINKLLEEFKISILDLSLITAAGPGSYTGMRLSEGISNILALCKVKTFSFYHFEVPMMIGKKSGRFVTNAFKNQYFIYEWQDEKNHQYLVNANDMNFSKEVYSNLSDVNFTNLISTSALIHENEAFLFEKIITRGTCASSFYFRSLDDEFTAIC